MTPLLALALRWVPLAMMPRFRLLGLMASWNPLFQLPPRGGEHIGKGLLRQSSRIAGKAEEEALCFARYFRRMSTNPELPGDIRLNCPLMGRIREFQRPAQIRNAQLVQAGSLQRRPLCQIAM